MTLGWRSPWRNRSANPSASLTSVLRALSPLASRAVVKLTATAPARRLKTGRPYTPVLSSATCVHPSCLSQSRSRSQSAVIVEQGRTSFLPGFSTQATRSLACTAIPQQLAYRTSLESLLPVTAGEPARVKSLLCGLAATVSGAWPALGSGYRTGARHQGDSTSCPQ